MARPAFTNRAVIGPSWPPRRYFCVVARIVRPKSALGPWRPTLEKRATNELAHVIGDRKACVFGENAQHPVLGLREEHVQSLFPFDSRHGVIMHIRGT